MRLVTGYSFLHGRMADHLDTFQRCNFRARLIADLFHAWKVYEGNPPRDALVEFGLY